MITKEDLVSSFSIPNPFHIDRMAKTIRYIAIIYLAFSLITLLSSCQQLPENIPSTAVVSLKAAPQSSTSTPFVSPTSTANPTSTIQPTYTSTPTQTVTATPVPTLIGGGSGKIIFRLWKKDFSPILPNLKGESHIFLSNLDGSDLVTITDGLLAHNSPAGISPNGVKLLFLSWMPPKDTGDLYISNSDGSNRFKLAQNVLIEALGLWITDQQIAYVTKVGQERSIFISNLDGSQIVKIPILDKTPYHLLYFDPISRWLYWESATLSGNSLFTYGYFRKNIDHPEEKEESIWKNIYLEGPISGDRIVWKDLETLSKLYISNFDETNQILMPTGVFGPTQCTPCAYLSPDGAKLFVYNPTNDPGKSYLISLSDSSIREFPEAIPQAFWSPDGRLIFATKRWTENFQPKIIDPETMSIVSELPNNPLFNGIDKILWLPPAK